jgi:hypothetical protein
MTERPGAPDPSSPERNPRGLGARDAEGSNTGSIADTSYNAHGSDPYTTGEPRKDFTPSGSAPADEPVAANPDVPISDSDEP